MRAKLVTPKGWRRLKPGDVIKNGDRIFNQYFNDLEWTLCIQYGPYSDGVIHYGKVMRGEKMATIRRIGK